MRRRRLNSVGAAVRGAARRHGLIALVLLASLASGLLTVRAQGAGKLPSGTSVAAGRMLTGDAMRGQALYGERCAACHSVDANEAGPMHRGVLGRRAGTVPGFEYSPALRASGLVWTRQTLDAWLRDPEALVPGQAMDEQVDDPQVRQDLISYLATLR